MQVTTSMTRASTVREDPHTTCWIVDSATDVLWLLIVCQVSAPISATTDQAALRCRRPKIGWLSEATWKNSRRNRPVRGDARPASDPRGYSPKAERRLRSPNQCRP